MRLARICLSPALLPSLLSLSLLSAGLAGCSSNEDPLWRQARELSERRCEADKALSKARAEGKPAAELAALAARLNSKAQADQAFIVELSRHPDVKLRQQIIAYMQAESTKCLGPGKQAAGS